MKDPADAGLQLRAGALRPRNPRRGAAVQHDGRARGDRRDRVRAAADPRLRAGRARRLVQAARAGRHAAGAGRSSTPRAARIQTHLNWIQVRPGERRTCDGCHSPRRGASLNSGPLVNTVPTAPAAWLPSTAPVRARRWPRLRTRLDPSALAAAGRHGVHRHLGRHGAPAAWRVRRCRSATPATPTRPTTWSPPAPANGLINYPQHVAPIWTQRGSRRQHLHHLPRRPGQARPARDHRRAPAASPRTRS